MADSRPGRHHPAASGALIMAAEFEEEEPEVAADEEKVETMVCGDDKTHLTPHFWQDVHTGKTMWCPGHKQIG